MAQFIDWECGGDGHNSDDDFEDDGWRPGNGRDRDAGSGRRANRRGRGGENRFPPFHHIDILNIGLIINAIVKYRQ